MNTNLRRSCSFNFAVALGCAALATTMIQAPRASADEIRDREAAPHFNRAVQLYSEADYRAALVEFKRAYEISPNVTVLYNLGETYYQLQNYAAALDTFEQFLREGGTTHRAEVEKAIPTLQARVGKVDVTTATPGWEIAIDDEVIGKTPLAKPPTVSIGRRKITATPPDVGAAPQTRVVDVSAGEVVPLGFALRGGPMVRPPPPHEERRGGASDALLTAGWIGTGVLGVGAIVTGIVAVSEASSLKTARDTFPGNKDDISSKASTTTTFSVLSDVLGPTAIVLGGVTLYFQLTQPSKSSSTSARLGISGQKLLLEGTF